MWPPLTDISDWLYQRKPPCYYLTCLLCPTDFFWKSSSNKVLRLWGEVLSQVKEGGTENGSEAWKNGIQNKGQSSPTKYLFTASCHQGDTAPFQPQLPYQNGPTSNRCNNCFLPSPSSPWSIFTQWRVNPLHFWLSTPIQKAKPSILC